MEYIAYYYSCGIYEINLQHVDTAEYFMGTADPDEYYGNWIMYPNESFMMIPNAPGNWQCD
jgi:hypothetical protein